MLNLAEKFTDVPQEATHLRVIDGSTEQAKMLRVGDLFAPRAPATLADTGIAPEILSDLFLKTAYSVASITTETVVKSLCLPMALVNELLDQLKRDKLIEVLGEAGRMGNYRLAITTRGHERAARLLDVCGYVGPAPVSLEAYAESLAWQLAHLPETMPEEVEAAIKDLVLSDTAIEIAGLAGSSGRSLFMYGPPGNGKTTLGHLLHAALKGQLWIPHCIGIDNDAIVVFDPAVHEPVAVDLPKEISSRVDRRWVYARRPFVVAAGELTLDALELSYSPGRRYYEAPTHIKANGGILLLDDFGRQRVDPEHLVNRWLYPLEHRADYLTLQTGRKLCFPFRQMLIFSSNLEPDDTMDGSFLRRLGYRLRIGTPDRATYVQIFTRYAERSQVNVPPGLIERLLERYQREQRPLRSSEPRDLIERARDICTYRRLPLELTPDVMNRAWACYFGESTGSRTEPAFA